MDVSNKYFSNSLLCNNESVVLSEWRQDSFYGFILVVDEVMGIYLGFSYWIVFSG